MCATEQTLDDKSMHDTSLVTKFIPNIPSNRIQMDYVSMYTVFYSLDKLLAPSFCQCKLE